MLEIILLISPVFSLIALGTLAGRLGWLSDAAEKGIGEFAFTLAIPALLCKTIATADFAGLSVTGIWASFYAGAAVTWLAATLLTQWPLGRPAADAPAIAISSAFGNSVMLGIPIAIMTYGQAATPTIALVLSIHAAVLWLTATLHARLVGGADPGEQGGGFALLARELGTNPIIIGILAGGAWRLTGLAMPKPVLDVLGLLAQAGVPAALIALGLSLTRFKIAGQIPTLTVITALKLGLMPAVAFMMAFHVMALPPVPAGVVVILAAVPTGANAYIFAQRNGRAANSASGAVALGTLVSIATISILLVMMRP
ncbi:MAG: AEC family transporter [Hyphomicrobiaceae bacterium]|nr:AEC family transporter [Hyphomicrobiaceae bacterium]